MHACLQTHATAFVGQGVDRRLYALTGRNADRAAAAAGRRPRYAAVGLVIRKVHDRKARVMTMDAARRRERIRLYRGVGRARGRDPIVAAVKYAARPVEAELDLYTVLEHHPHARGGHGYPPGAACVELAAVVDLDAIELMLEAAIAAARRQLARVKGGRHAFRLDGHASR